MSAKGKDIKRLILLAVSGVFPPSGGIGRYISHSIDGEILAGVIIAPYEKAEPFRLDSGKWKILRTRPLWERQFLRRLSFLETLTRFLPALRKAKPDFIVCSHIGTGITGLLLKILLQHPLIIFGHGLEIVSGRYLFFRRALFKRADLVITNSAFSREMLLAAGVRRDKIRILPPGVDTSFFHPHKDIESVREKYSIGRQSLNLLTVARLDPKERYKGHDRTIRALPKVLSQFPALDYLIAGKGEDTQRLLNISREVGVENHVKFLGFVPEQDLPSLYSLSDIFIMPSREMRDGGTLKYEGFGIVFLEANACGTPVIGGNSGGIPDVIEDDVNGLLVDPQDPDKIAEAIIGLLKDTDYRKRLGENGLKKAREEFDRSVVAQKFIEIVGGSFLC